VDKKASARRAVRLERAEVMGSGQSKQTGRAGSNSKRLEKLEIPLFRMQKKYPVQRCFMVTRSNGLLHRQRRFCDGVAQGLSGAEAARQAGYSPSRAKQTAHRLIHDLDIQAGIARRLNGYDPHPTFDDPLKFLQWAMTDPEAYPLKLRIKVAVALLPYFHGK
jgi:hypothetical protein